MHRTLTLAFGLAFAVACSKTDNGETESSRLEQLDAGDAAKGTELQCSGGAQRNVRAIAANLTSGNNQTWDLGHGTRILQGLHPDIVLMQEFNVGDNSETALKNFVAEALGGDFPYVRGNGDIPNGILSRYPIRESGEWADPLVTNRGFTWAKIDIPGEMDLFAVSVHLLKYDIERLNAHVQEAEALLAELGAHSSSGEFRMLGGDFNTRFRDDPGLTTLGKAFAMSGPFPEGPAPLEADPTCTNERRNYPYDWVVADPQLEHRKVAVKVGDQAFPNGLVFDSAYFGSLEAVVPVELGDSHAEGMQHMAVVRDFAFCE